MPLLEKKAVLYIEDDPGIAMLVQGSLERSGYVVQVSETGQDGVRKYDKSIHDVVISDYRLPDMDGLQVIKGLQSKNDGLPVIMLTGGGNEKIAVEALKIGAADYLVKDSGHIFLELLPTIIDAALRTKNLIQENERQRSELQFYAKELEDRNKELSRMARSDSLTGLANRSVFQDALVGAIARAVRNKQGMALLMLDFNGFKHINDTYGHLVGDLVLKEVSSRFKHAIRESDHISRIGGDEFAIILESTSETKDIMVVINKLFEKLTPPVLIEEDELQITVSIGIATYPTCGSTAKQLSKNADAALYLSKSEEGNAYQFFTKELNDQALEIADLEKEMEQGIKMGEFSLHFQPQYASNTLEIVGMEALLRWSHNSKGNIPPNVFIPIAERSKIINELGIFVLENACRQALSWKEEGKGAMPVSVNVSPQQFREKNFADRVFSVLKSCDFDPHLLELEITESSLIRNMVHCQEILKKLRDAGIKISIDDFGTGYASIAHLRQLPIDILKIDKSLVNNITTDGDEAAIACAIIDLAHHMNLKVVAEGVETKEQMEFLRSKQCDILQGYLLGKPMPYSDFTEHLKKVA